MNATDKWMLDQMQQMAAAMAATLPQTGQNSEPPKTEKGESFRDLMDKAKDQKAEASEKAETPKKAETPEKAENVQKSEPRKAEIARNPDGTTTAKVELTAAQAAMIAAGYSQLLVREDGTVMIATAVNENGGPTLPAIYLEQYGKSVFTREWPFIENGDQWVIEPSVELESALEDLLLQMDDPRSVSGIMDALTAKFQEVQGQGKTQVVIAEPETAEQAGQTGDREESDDLDAKLTTASQPLFKDVKTAPVKVGENFQLDTRQPELEARLADTIRYAAQQDLRQIEIRLSPENLGNLTVKLTQMADGSLQVVLHTANAKAANLLSQHLDGLNAALQGYSQNSEVRVEVQRNEDSQQAQQQQTNPDGHNRQQQQQQRQEQHSDSRDFAQRLRLGLFGADEA